MTSVPKRIVVLAVAVGFISLAAFLWGRSDARLIDPVGTVYEDVLAEPTLVPCGLDPDSTTASYTVTAAGIEWYHWLELPPQPYGSTESPFDGESSYRGRLTIVDLKDDSGATYYAIDSAEFVGANGIKALLHPAKPQC